MVMIPAGKFIMGSAEDQIPSFLKDFDGSPLLTPFKPKSRSVRLSLMPITLTNMRSVTASIANLSNPQGEAFQNFGVTTVFTN